MKYTLPILLVLGLLVGCEQSKPAVEPSEAETAKISSDSDKKAKTKADEGAPDKVVVVDPKAGETKKTGDDGHKMMPPTAEDIAAAEKRGIFGLGKTPADIGVGESKVYGGDFVNMNEPVTLADAIAEPSDDVIKVSANVKAVCQKKGCWMTLEDKGMDLPIRVKMVGYRFFVPKNAGGAAAVLEGTLKKTVISQAEAQHYADDAAEGTGKPAKKITGDVDSYVFMASAIQLTKPKS